MARMLQQHVRRVALGLTAGLIGVVGVIGIARAQDGGESKSVPGPDWVKATPGPVEPGRPDPSEEFAPGFGPKAPPEKSSEADVAIPPDQVKMAEKDIPPQLRDKVGNVWLVTSDGPVKEGNIDPTAPPTDSGAEPSDGPTEAAP